MARGQRHNEYWIADLWHLQLMAGGLFVLACQHRYRLVMLL
jgi:hypothetical protein